MTKVNNYQNKFKTSDFTRALQEYQQVAQDVTYGMEMEKFIIKYNGELPDAYLHDEFYKSLAEILKDKVSVEPGAHMIEIKTGVHKDSRSLETELNKFLKILKKKAKKHKLKVLDSAEISNADPEELKKNFVSLKDPFTGHVRRAPSIMEAYTKLGFGAIVDYAMNSTSVHFTHSTKNMNELHRWAKVHSAFMPLYYAVFENRQRTADGYHTTMYLRKNMQDRCLLLDYPFKAVDGDDLARKYVEYVENTTLYSKLDKNGDDKTLEKTETFLTLPEEEKTLGNFLQAASFQWGVCKIKPTIDEGALKNGQLKFSNLLLEVRDFETSDQSVSAVAGWLGNFVMTEENLLEAESRLEDLGIPVVSNPEEAHKLIKYSLDNIGSFSNRFLDTSIGGKGATLRTMVNEIILPMLKHSNATNEVFKQWTEISTATEAPFKKINEHKASLAFNDNSPYDVNRQLKLSRMTAFM